MKGESYYFSGLLTGFVFLLVGEGSGRFTIFLSCLQGLIYGVSRREVTFLLVGGELRFFAIF